jgi:hypothetical protein
MSHRAIRDWQGTDAPWHAKPKAASREFAAILADLQQAQVHGSVCAPSRGKFTAQPRFKIDVRIGCPAYWITRGCPVLFLAK